MKNTPIKPRHWHSLIAALAALFIGWAGATYAAPVAASDRGIEIIRDSNGVAQIYGKTGAEVFYGFGYMVATDRLFQIEMRKREAVGRVAEVLGRGTSDDPNKYFQHDVGVSQLLPQSEVVKEYDALAAADKALLQAYTDGVNAKIKEVLADPDKLLSKQFTHFGFKPEYWTVYDTLSVAIGTAGGYSVFSTEIENYDLYQFLKARFPQDCDDIFNQFIWKDDPNTPTTMQDYQQGGANAAQPGRQGCVANGKAPNGLKLFAAKISTADARTQIGEISTNPHDTSEMLVPRRASMAWLVGSDKAKGFASMLINGPQSGWHSPGYYYAVGLHGGNFDFVGFSAEGSVIFKIGVSHYFAWGLTAGLSQTVDEYQEQLDAPGGHHYLWQGKWRPFTEKNIVIHVKGEPDQKLTLDYSLHGPVVERRDGEAIAFTRKTAWTDEGGASVVAWIHAITRHDFKSWVLDGRQVAFNCNWLFAGRDGKVGFIHTGLFPNHMAGADFRLPQSGDGDHEWAGLKPMDKNPSMETRGYIVNFNNKPTRNWPNSGIYWEEWSAANQVNTLIKELEAKPRLDWADMWAVNRAISYRDVNAPYFIPAIVSAAARAHLDGEAAAAVKLLASWNLMRTDDNRDGHFDNPGQTIFDAWLPVMVKNTLAPTLQGFKHAELWLAAGYQTGEPVFEEHPTAGTLITYYALMNAEGKKPGVTDYYDFFKGRASDAVIIASLEEALATLHKQYKGPMTGWLEKAPGQRFITSDTAGIPMTTPENSFITPLYANRGVMNMQAGFSADGKIAKAAFVDPPGNTAFVSPKTPPEPQPFFNDQFKRYYNMELAPLYLERDEVMAHMAGQHLWLPVPPVY